MSCHKIAHVKESWSHLIIESKATNFSTNAIQVPTFSSTDAVINKELWFSVEYLSTLLGCAALRYFSLVQKVLGAVDFHDKSRDCAIQDGRPGV